VILPFRRRDDPSARDADLTICRTCGSGYVIPTDWAERGESSWWIRLRCGECESIGEVVVSDATAERYDQRLDEGMSEIALILRRLEREAMARDAETFAAALELDLLDAGDFAR
jgi:hypothetical protein